LSDNKKNYNKQLSNLVGVTPFYGIGLSSKLDGFSAHYVFSELSSEHAVSMQLLGKRRKRKRIRKRPTLSGAGSGSKKSQE